MSLRQLPKEATKTPKKALFLFPQEDWHCPHLANIEKNVPLKEGNSDKVDWARKKVQAEILALHSKSEIIWFSWYPCISKNYKRNEIPFLIALYTLVLNHTLLLFADDEAVLTNKDLEWCAENLTVPSSSVKCTELSKEAQQPSESPGQSKVKSKAQKVCSALFILISFSCFHVWHETTLVSTLKFPMLVERY